jgi:hypothetical protein
LDERKKIVFIRLIYLMSQKVAAAAPLKEESDLMRTVFAGIGSICAASVTHPIDTIKIRLQIQGEGNGKTGR